MSQICVPERVTRRCAVLLGRADELSRMGMSSNPSLVSYESELIDWDEQIAAGARSVRFILSTIGDLESELEVRFPVYLGRTRAERGVPSDELLQALNIDFEMCWSALTSDEAQLDRHDMLALGAQVWRTIEHYTNAVLLAYHEREQELRRLKRLRADATIASFLTRNEHRPGSTDAALTSIGFDLHQNLVAIATLGPAEEIEQRLDDPRSVLRISTLPEGTFALWQPLNVSVPSDVLEGLDLVWDTPPEPNQVPQALRALCQALHAVSQNSGPRLLSDTLMDQTARWLGDSQDYLLKQRLHAYHRLTPTRQERIREVAEVMSSSTTVSEAARKLYVHRNTLVQRLNLIRSRIGFDLQVPRQLAEFRLLIQASAYTS